MKQLIQHRRFSTAAGTRRCVPLCPSRQSYYGQPVPAQDIVSGTPGSIRAKGLADALSS